MRCRRGAAAASSLLGPHVVATCTRLATLLTPHSPFPPPSAGAANRLPENKNQPVFSVTLGPDSDPKSIQMRGNGMLCIQGADRCLGQSYRSPYDPEFTRTPYAFLTSTRDHLTAIYDPATDMFTYTALSGATVGAADVTWRFEPTNGMGPKAKAELALITLTHVPRPAVAAAPAHSGGGGGSASGSG